MASEIGLTLPKNDRAQTSIFCNEECLFSEITHLFISHFPSSAKKSMNRQSCIARGTTLKA